jgi:hypothetical protein
LLAAKTEDENNTIINSTMCGLRSEDMRTSDIDIREQAPSVPLPVVGFRCYCVVSKITN